MFDQRKFVGTKEVKSLSKNNNKNIISSQENTPNAKHLYRDHGLGWIFNNKQKTK